jgi:hypothetical protein
MTEHRPDDAAVRNVEALLKLGAVAVIGAGVSLPVRYPSSAGLQPLLWHALDADQPERARLADRLRRTDAPGKALIGYAQELTAAAWEVVSLSSLARQAFQSAFAAIDAERANVPSPAHDALVRLLHAWTCPGFVDTWVRLPVLRGGAAARTLGD